MPAQIRGNREAETQVDFILFPDLDAEQNTALNHPCIQPFYTRTQFYFQYKGGVVPHGYVNQIHSLKAC